MTKYYSVNKAYASGDGVGCIYDLVNTLVSASWTIQSASNGTSFGAGTTYWAPTSLANSNAWVTVREPTGPDGREWCFQRTTDNYTWRVKISPYAGFSGGSPSATQVPSATDEGVNWGAGTDASPTGYQLFQSTYPFKFHIIAESTPVGPVGNEAYGFWAFSNLNGSFDPNYMYNFISQEPLAVGSYPALTGSRAATTSGEADPCLYGCNFAASFGYTFSIYLLGYATDANQNNNTFKYFYKYQNASGSLTNAYDVNGSNFSNTFPRWIGQHPCSAEDVGLPISYGRHGTGTASGYAYIQYTNIGLKGTCNFLKWASTNRSTGVVTNLSTNAYIYAYSLLIPWPENIVPEF
jgi:hypothetical protein